MMNRLLYGWRTRTPQKSAGAHRKRKSPGASIAFCVTESLEQRVLLSNSQILVVNGTTVGEYNSNGSTVNSSLIAGLSNADGIAVSGANVFVPQLNSGLSGDGSVEEYTTSGEIVNGSLITGL